MNYFKNYILNGKGIAAIYIAFAALLVTLFISLAVSSFYDITASKAGALAARVAPIKIENGVITVPENQVIVDQVLLTKKEYLPIIIDTTKDYIETSGMRPGIYLSRTKAFLKSERKIEIREYPDSFTLEKRDYTEDLKEYKTPVLVVCAVIAFIFSFFWIFLYNLLLALLSYIVSAAVKKDYSFEQRVRLSVLIYILISFAEIPLAFTSTFLSALSKILIICILQAVFMLNDKRQQDNVPPMPEKQG